MKQVGELFELVDWPAYWDSTPTTATRLVLHKKYPKHCWWHHGGSGSGYCNDTIQQWVTNNSHQSQHFVAHMVDLDVVVPCCPCSVLILISTACDEYNTQQFCNFVILQHVFVFFVFPLFQLFSPQRVALTTSHPRRRSLCRCPVFSCEICF